MRGNGSVHNCVADSTQNSLVPHPLQLLFSISISIPSSFSFPLSPFFSTFLPHQKLSLYLPTDTIFHFFHNLQTHKPLSMRFYSLFARIAKTFRLLQLCASLLLLYWILTSLSSALQISRLYFHSLAALIASPLFVFLISNAIIATLFANSRRLIGHNSDGRNVEMEIFRQFTKRDADHAELPSEVDTDQSHVAEQMDCQDKQIVSDNTTARTLRDQVEFDSRTDTDSTAEPESDHPKVYLRSQSENLMGASRKELERNLRRSETEKCRETTKPRENLRENLYPHDRLSNEEFQRTIEAFIAKQMRFLREESLAIVVRKQS